MSTAQGKQTNEIKLRPARFSDAEILGQICYSAFKTVSEAHNFPPDFPSPEAAVGLISMLLANPGVYSVTAEDSHGKLVGSNFLWESDAVAGVGPITVDPLVQAAFHNRSLALYTKLGFDTVEPLSNIQGAPLGLKIDGHNVRVMSVSDL